MGRIKSTLVKRTANNLLKNENKFSEDFGKNKDLLRKNLKSKSVRNKISGYIARLKRMQREKIAKTEITNK